MNYYQILGVESNATEKEIGDAYRTLARKYHPDVSQDSNSVEKFKQVAEAYEVLSDVEKRSQYDRYGSVGVGKFDGIDPFDVFSHVFGNRKKRGKDRLVEISLSFKESFFGCKKIINVSKNDICNHCNGSGIKKWKTCEQCQGSGCKIVQQRPFVLSVGCPSCRGQGKIVEENCQTCNGTGCIETGTQEVPLEIPAGVDEGMQIRLSGLGDFDSSHTVRGNLFVLIRVKKHEFFERNGIDLWCKVPIPYSRLILGDKISIPTMNKTIELKIPPNTRPGTKLRIKGQGIPNIHTANRCGDIVVVVELDMPIIDNEYKKKLKELSIIESKLISNERKKWDNYVDGSKS